MGAMNGYAEMRFHISKYLQDNKGPEDMVESTNSVLTALSCCLKELNLNGIADRIEFTPPEQD